MFKYENSLKVWDKDKYPYSMEYVKESRYGHNHGMCDESGFAVMAVGSKHLFCTPRLQKMSLKMNVNFMKSVRNQAFGLIFGYDRNGNVGNEVQFSYGGGRLSVALMSFSGKSKWMVKECVYENVHIDGKTTVLNLCTEENAVKGKFGKYSFNFACAVQMGRIGFEVGEVYGKIIFSDVLIVSKEKQERTKVFGKSFTLPCENGGMIPYTADINVFSLGDVYEIEYTIDGGISTRTPANLYSDVWITQFDDLTEPYIKLVSEQGVKKLYLYTGTARFLDQNLDGGVRAIYEHVLKVKDTPFKGSFFVGGFEDTKFVGIGYEQFNAWSYMTMCGSCEYLFDIKGNLVYGGQPLDGNSVAKFVSVDKRIVNNIPKVLADYHKAVTHAKNNHYFYTDEKASFELYVYTADELEFLNVSICVLDAFFKKLSDVKQVEECVLDFDACGYKLKKYSFRLENLPCGVYHISADILSGDEVTKNHCASFEVIDENSEISPPEASGLPVMYLGDGAPALSRTCVPDFYAEKSEYDFGHYFSVGLYVPITAQEQQIPEIAKLYKRKVFTWNTKRTINGYDISKLDDIITKSDFNNYFYPDLEDCPVYYRFDLYNYASYTRFLRQNLNEFLSFKTEYKKTLGIEDAASSFTEQDFLNMLRSCGPEWIEFALVKIRESFTKQTAELKKKNPNQKRCSYGPWPAYNSNYKGGYSIKWYGFDPEKLHETFDGFMQFEDYPFSSAYGSYACAWSVLTTKLLDSKVKIYPELYFSFPDACPDTAVTEAFPPFGGSDCPVYFTKTQICEYAYNTPFYTDGKFGYWTDYGFSIFSFIDKPMQRAKEILSLWGVIKDNKPARPYKTAVFLYDINCAEDRYEYEVAKDHFFNISESNLAYVYGIMKSSGLTGGFAARFKDILTLDENDVNCIVLPDMTEASKEITDRIRELHRKGVTLIAVSKVTGLEDLFGVRVCHKYVTVNDFSDGVQTEYVTQTPAEFSYDADGGEVVLYANGDIPVIITTENTVLLNTCVSAAGIDLLPHIAYHGRPNISALLASKLSASVTERIDSLAISDKDTGLTVFETDNGETLLLVTDYSKYTLKSDGEARRVKVIFRTDDFSDAVPVIISDENPCAGKTVKDGVLKGITLTLRPQETVMFKLGKI